MEIDKPLLKSLLMIADIIEARDPYTGGHVWRVSQFAKLLATKVELPEDEIIKISIAAYLHDLGKVGIPDDILRKTERLTDAEYAIIKTHPSIGSKLLGGHPLAEMVSSAANEHHERIDGKGYPNGLRGEQLSLTARIVSIADAFDAMTSTRPYRRAMSVEQALDRIEEGAGTQFDAELASHMRELGRAGDLAHIVGHTVDGIPAVTCPHCGAVIAIPRNTKDGKILYCRACHSQLELHRAGDRFETEITGMTNDPRNLEPRANEDAAEDLLAQIS
ncbi:MAG: HD domain-containing protein [Anaerolineae bacterium]|nr:HD domain-containing protein [Anaerolineae bacterium]MCI0611217.1 HD domain-containing protein [Anaerolineae bacterium]